MIDDKHTPKGFIKDAEELIDPSIKNSGQFPEDEYFVLRDRIAWALWQMSLNDKHREIIGELVEILSKKTVIIGQSCQCPTRLQSNKHAYPCTLTTLNLQDEIYDIIAKAKEVFEMTEPDKDLTERATKISRELMGGSWFTTGIDPIARFAQEVRDEELKKAESEYQRAESLKFNKKWFQEQVQRWKAELEAERKRGEGLAKALDGMLKPYDITEENYYISQEDFKFAKKALAKYEGEK